MLLPHGGGLDSADFTYKYIIGPLAEERRVLAPGWPRYGPSDKPDVEYTVPFYVGFLEQLVDALGLERTSLVGISMGAAVALGFALRAPERIEKLVLVDSYGLGGQCPGGVWALLDGACAVTGQTYVRVAAQEPLDGSVEPVRLVHDRSMVTSVFPLFAATERASSYST